MEDFRRDGGEEVEASRPREVERERRTSSSSSIESERKGISSWTARGGGRSEANRVSVLSSSLMGFIPGGGMIVGFSRWRGVGGKA